MKVTLWITESSPIVGNSLWAVYAEDDCGGQVELLQHNDHAYALGHARNLVTVLRDAGTTVRIVDDKSAKIETVTAKKESA